MTKRMDNLRVAWVVSMAALLSACQTVKLPKIENFVKSPEFSEDALKVGTDYPDIDDAPLLPSDVRSAREWDKDVRALQALRDGSGRIAAESGPSEAQAQSEFRALKAKAQAYKKDDPPGNLNFKFPNYKPRR